ncbi:MAG: redoxin domain-containing protein [Planctomycetaceae bacterium]
MRKIFLIPPAAAIVIGGLAVWKLSRPAGELLLAARDPGAWRRAPLFELYDENSQLVRVSRYIGRHKLLIVFFNGESGPDRNELLLALRREFVAIHESRALVLAISGLRPSEHRPPPGAQGERTRREEPFPFALLSDIDDFRVHRLFGAFDEQAQAPREAVFVVDRLGLIRFAHLGPDELGAPAQWATELQQVK